MEGRTKVCILRHAYFPDDPTVRKEAFALLEAGHTVDIICLRKPGELRLELVKQIRVYRIPLMHKRKGIARYLGEYTISLITMCAVLSYLSLFKRYGCVQVNTMPDALVFATIVPKLLGARVVLHLHEPTPELWITKHGANRLRPLLRMQMAIEQLAIRYSDHCLTVTNALRQRFVERGASIDKITVIPNVCEEETFTCPADASKDGSNGSFRLVTHGLIEDRYGHDIIVKAISMIKHDIPGLRVEILGEGPNMAQIQQLAQDLGCSIHIQFSGFVPVDQLLESIHKADVAMIAMKRSPYSELIDTTKMYEYIALRKPIIVSRLPAIEDNFSEECVAYFAPDDPADLARVIKNLFEHPDTRVEHEKRAYLRYQELRWRETKKIYVDVIRGSRRR